MREIRFRAWDKRENKMWFPSAMRADGVPMAEGPTGLLMSMDGDLLDPVMQYTGLRDKTRTPEHPNGKEIYEGDLFRFEYYGLCVVKFGKYMAGGTDYYATRSWRIIEWLYKRIMPTAYGFFLEPIKRKASTMTLDSRDEIIGNIHENHELLEENNQEVPDAQD